jgi:uncharacterized protein YceK
MRQVCVPLLVLAVAAHLSGCSETGADFTRSDFPSVPGNYVQFYENRSTTIVELAKVDVAGRAVAIKSAHWNGRVSQEAGVFNQTANFSECGQVVTFKMQATGKVSASWGTYSETAKAACLLNTLPVEWVLVGPMNGRS